MKGHRIGLAWAGGLLVACSVSTACHSVLHTGKQGGGGSTRAEGGTDTEGVGGAGSAGGAGGAGSVANGGADSGGAGGAGGGVNGGAGSAALGGMGGVANGGAGGGAGGSGTPAYGGAGGGSNPHVGGNGPPAGGNPSGRAGGGGTRASGGAGMGGIVVVGGAGGMLVGGAGGQVAGGVTGRGGEPVAGTATGPFALGGTPGYGTGERPSDWTPPVVADVGAQGWKQSTSPLCDTSLQQRMDPTADAWADDRGVFLLIGDSYDQVVYLNSGSEWRTFYQAGFDQASALRLLGGLPDGRLVFAGSFEKRFGVAFLDDKEGMVFQTPLGFGASGLAVTKDGSAGGRAYVASGSMLEYSEGSWSPVDSQDLGLRSVWTDGKVVVGAGWDQTVVMGTVDGPLLPLKGIPAGDYYAVWGFAANDLWFGSSGPQLVHYDGNKWELHETGSLSHAGIQQLWGESGILYFATDTEFGRWNGTAAEILLRPPAGTDSDLATGKLGQFWARSANEVFIPLRDKRYWGYTCGSTFMLWFDGSQFHAF